jgi:hypothetical protein
MMQKKHFLAALLVLPLAAFAQGPGPGSGPGSGPGPGASGAGRGQPPGPGRGMRQADPERLERRMRLARTLGLAEALDLDAPQALKLGDTLAKFDERRLAAHQQLREAHRVLRDAADAEKPTAHEVDGAIQKALDARAQLAAIDRETLQAVSKELSPAQRARAVLFLDRFQKRFRGLGPDPVELRRVIQKRVRDAQGAAAGARARSFAFRMEGPPPGPGLEPPPPPDVFLFEDGDGPDDVDLEVELERN